mgnify:CR=1 FL=1
MPHHLEPLIHLEATLCVAYLIAHHRHDQQVETMHQKVAQCGTLGSGCLLIKQKGGEGDAVGCGQSADLCQVRKAARRQAERTACCPCPCQCPALLARTCMCALLPSTKPRPPLRAATAGAEAAAVVAPASDPTGPLLWADKEERRATPKR